MPDNQKPLVPNYVPGVGALTTYRLEYAKHIDGSGDRQNATTIDLFPDLVIGGTTTTTVQTALQALLSNISPTPVLATATTPGLVQLSASGDVQGTATQLKVTKLQGFPLNALTPTINYVLTWNGSSWISAPSQGSFTPGNDLTGTASLQYVVGLTGTGTSPNATVRLSNDILQFISSATPQITQAYVSNTNATNTIIEAQGVSSGTGNGGNLNLLGGLTTNGLRGGVNLSVGGNPATSERGIYLFQLAQVVSGQYCAAFFPSSVTGLTSTDMPANTGSSVIYIGDSLAPPSAPSPTGSILWSQGGQLNIMQENGSSFVIGSTSATSVTTALSASAVPITTFPTSGSVVYSTTVVSNPSTPATALTFTVPASCSMYLEVIYVGKLIGSASQAQYKVNGNVVRNGTGTPVFNSISTDLDGTPFQSDSSWFAPSTIAISGSNVVIATGANGPSAATWTVNTSIFITTA